MRKLALSFIKFYQKYISKLTPASCRYYPSCSEYAVWQLENNNIFLAICAIFMRILRCNQLFKGGIDYPIVSKKFGCFLSSATLADVKFWLVPCQKNKFYVIKVLDSLKDKR